MAVKKAPPKKKGKENPKGDKALAALKACESAILDADGRPPRLPPRLRPDWERDTQFRLLVWTREIGQLAKRSSKINTVLACSTLLQGYLKILDIGMPPGVFKEDLRSPGKGRKPSIDAAPLLRERDREKSYGQIGNKYFTDLSPVAAYMKARDRIKSAQGRFQRSTPLDGPLFDQVCRMFGLSTPEEEIAEYIRRIEEGDFDEPPLDNVAEFDEDYETNPEWGLD